MQLLIAPASPFVRKVRILLRETGQLSDVTEVSVSTTPIAPDPRVVAANPVGKIPALLRDDGPALHDSRVITRFLDDRAGAGLYPKARLWDVLTLEATADGIMESAVLLVYEGRFRTPEAQSQPWIEGQWARITRSLTTISEVWTPLLAGPLHMGQIGTACALGYLDFRQPTYDWRSTHPALGTWFAGFNARQSMVDTAPV